MTSELSARPLDAAIRRRSGVLRRASSMAGWAICGLALLALVGMMLSILGVVFVMSALSPELFTSVTTGRGGGLLNAIEGHRRPFRRRPSPGHPDRRRGRHLFFRVPLDALGRA